MYHKHAQLFYFLSFLPVPRLTLHAPSPPTPACHVGTLQGVLLHNQGLRLGNVGEQMEHWVNIKMFATDCLSEHQTFLRSLLSTHGSHWSLPCRRKPKGPSFWHPHQSPLSVSGVQSSLNHFQMWIHLSCSHSVHSDGTVTTVTILSEIGWLRDIQNPLTYSKAIRKVS